MNRNQGKAMPLNYEMSIGHIRYLLAAVSWNHVKAPKIFANELQPVFLTSITLVKKASIIFSSSISSDLPSKICSITAIEDSRQKQL